MAKGMHQVTQRNQLVICLATLMGLLLIMGCGIKGPPVAPGQVRSVTIQNLHHEVEDGRLTMTWGSRSKGDISGPTGFFVFRAAMPLAADGCKNCPPKFEPVARIPFALDGQHAYTEQLTEGQHYYYKISAILPDGREGQSSEIVEIVY